MNFWSEFFYLWSLDFWLFTSISRFLDLYTKANTLKCVNLIKQYNFFKNPAIFGVIKHPKSILFLIITLEMTLETDANIWELSFATFNKLSFYYSSSTSKFTIMQNLYHLPIVSPLVYSFSWTIQDYYFCIHFDMIEWNYYLQTCISKTRLLFPNLYYYWP